MSSQMECRIGNQPVPSSMTFVYVYLCEQVFALSVLELGTLVGLSMGEGCDFYHDPFMGKRYGKSFYPVGRQEISIIC
jgi:hypothetical protein